MVQALLDGLDFINLTHEGDYVTFAAQYLMREEKGGPRPGDLQEIHSSRRGSDVYQRLAICFESGLG